MTRRSVLVTVATTLLLVACQATTTRPRSEDARAVTPHAPTSPNVTAASLAVAVTAADNRAVSFTNKRSAFYYTQTHVNDHPEHAYFSGFNIAGRRVFSEYQLRSGSQTYDPRTAEAIVRPDALIRRYPQGLTETLRLFDHQDVIAVETTGAGDDVALVLVGDMITLAPAEGGVDWYTSAEKGGHVSDFIAVGRSKGRFLIAVGPDRASARALYEQAVAHVDEWQQARTARLDAVISGDHYLRTDDPQLTAGLRWIMLTTDSLVTRQRGDGIYAGLPWFNEYWGRDSFIALPGAALVTGQFEQARAILTAFAKFQELDPSSKFYGRLPNIVKPGSIDYHTTDGTPRWVIAVREYVRYSGDRSVVSELYPNVRASIEGALANFTDASGFLVHADNETWMDARREPDKASYSPRSTRANDIQALWYEQLQAGAEFASALNDAESAAQWSQAATRVRVAFMRDFVDVPSAKVADHLDASDVPNFQQRPNALFALHLLPDHELSARVARRSWENLVYPWGVATLDRADVNFHPYHLAPEQYHKDAAYHNGTVWPWLNGIAMQRMLESGQTELAWRLFQNMNAIALTRGVVGGLPENLDAYPHPGAPWPRLTGTYLQAWSNSEQLRVWYQHILGVQPDMERGALRLAPRLPESLGNLEFNARLGAGTLHALYERSELGRRYTWRVEGQPVVMQLDIVPFATNSFPCSSGDSLVVQQGAQELIVTLVNAAGKEKSRVTLSPDRERQQQQARLDAILTGTDFAEAGRAESHPVMRQTRTR